mmetsp:Transcript_27986/g.74008  ORF Transcript_27986/g.74008 Transcript_27986/m.74008 type:complete len:256 (-) Transcript_27986:168-935(-)
MAPAEPPLWLAFAAGSFGGLCNTVAGYPLDTIKVRLQSGSKQQLFKGLFGGILTPVSGVVPFWMMYYGGYKVGRAMQPDDSTASVARAGAVAGLASSVVWCPMNAVKCVAQAERCGSLEALRRVLSRVGAAGLYRGFVPTLLLFSVPGSATFYFIYEESTILLPFGVWWVPFVAGGLAGVVEWTVGMPGDTIRTRYQTGFHHKSVASCVKDIWRGEGARGFYRGFSAALPRAFVANAAALAGIEAVNRAFRTASA